MVDQHTQYNFHSLLLNMPGLVWVKDLSLKYMGINQKMADFLGVDRTDIFLGHDDYQLPWGKYANIYQNADNYLLGKKSPVRFIEPMTINKNNQFFSVTQKSPYRDESGNTIGIIGSIINIKSQAAMQLLSEASQTDHASGINENGYILCDDYDQFGLTRREGHCLFYLIRGKSVPEIANLLFISKRTAENHIINIKNKFNCNSKSEIIDKAIDLGLVSYIPGVFLPPCSAFI